MRYIFHIFFHKNIFNAIYKPPKTCTFRYTANELNIFFQVEKLYLLVLRKMNRIIGTVNAVCHTLSMILCKMQSLALETSIAAALRNAALAAFLLHF